jgi:two-component sensor histidine kinase
MLPIVASGRSTKMSDGAVAIAAGAGKGRMAAAAEPEGKAVAASKRVGQGEHRGYGGPASDFPPGMMDRLPILIALVHGPMHRCVLANAAFRALAGDAPIVGKAVDQLFAGPGRGDLRALLERTRAEASGVRGTVPLGVDGEPVGADLECIPLTVAGEASVLIIGRDPTAAGKLGAWKSLPPAELSHRVNNTIAAARTVAGRTARSAGSLEEFLELFQDRLDALDTVQRLFAAGGWQRIGAGALVAALLEPHAAGDSRVRLHIDDVPLRSEAALTLALVIGELASNAARHGALSLPGGRVSVTGRLARENGNEALDLTWQEEGGPPVGAPERSGLETTVLSRTDAHDHGGQGALSWREEGLTYELRLPLV